MISYLQAENISRRIGDNLLFKDVNLNISADEKAALIAINGAGKSTMLDILAGNENPDTGSITARRGLRISYLKQIPVLNDSNKLTDELFCTESDLVKVIKEYETSLISGTPEMQHRALQKMDDHKAWDYEVAVKQILFKLNLTDLNATVGSLSGGQKKRVALAKVLVEDSDLLVLDEPTNHLDLDMIEWLEDYLINTSKSLLMVTHDRYFLDRICNVIFELSGTELVRYDGNYEYYLKKKEEREYAARSNVEKARNLLRTELDWISRMPKARRHKSKSRIDSFYELKQKAVLKPEDKSVNLNVRTARMGKKILELKGISKSYGDQRLIDNFSYRFNPYEKTGIVGRNGTGKSTLLDIITGLSSPDIGTVETGETVIFGYYRQQGISFDEDTKVIDAASKIAEQVMISDGKMMSISQFLNYFLFPPEKQHTLIRKLSGGEKRRLYLLTVLMKNPNFLILDEPTNDLDILTLNVLEEYLAGFRGCVIVVSHDRYFMDKVVDHIFEFKGEGEIKDFPGNYTQLRNKQEEEEELERSSKSDRSRKASADQKEVIKKEKKPGLTYREKQELETLTGEIQKLEEEKRLLEDQMSRGNLPPGEIYIKSKRHGDLALLLDEKEMRWLELSEK